MHHQQKSGCIYFPGRSFVVFLLLMMLPGLAGRSQRTLDYAVHANIIYQLTKYVDWPDDRKSGDFSIGIIGDSPLIEELKRISASKTVGGQKIVVRKIPASATTFNAHILFVGEETRSYLKKISAKTTGLPILIIGEEEGMAGHGACINFALVSDKLTLEINPKNIEQRNLRIASELMKLARIVK